MLATSDLVNLGVDEESIAEISRLIRLTARHITMEHDRLGKIMIDADLAILASPPGEYESYSKAIRTEYDWVDDVSYASGRSKVLKDFLAREHLFFSPTLNDAQARHNLAEELDRLNDRRL